MLRKQAACGKVLLTGLLTQDTFSSRRKVAANFQENTNAILGKGDIKKNVILVVRVGLGL